MAVKVSDSPDNVVPGLPKEENVASENALHKVHTCASQWIDLVSRQFLPLLPGETINSPLVPFAVLMVLGDGY